MNLERKLELMQRYDFEGFRGRFAAIGVMEARFRSRKLSPHDVKTKVEKLEDISTWAQKKYAVVDFDELERELSGHQDREDFETLFRTRDLLPQFGQAVERFSAYCRERSYDVPRIPEEFSAVYRIYIEIGRADKYNGVPYRLRKQKLEAELGAVPAIPK